MSAPENPQAFPHVTQSKASGSSTIYTHVTEGMTLRDWFAGQALASIMQDKAIWDSTPAEELEIAERMYRWADAMLAARKEEPR